MDKKYDVIDSLAYLVEQTEKGDTFHGLAYDEILKLRKEKAALRDRLKEAEEALKFYADPDHWLPVNDDPNDWTAINDSDEVKVGQGGKRARAYFEKWGGKG